MAEQEAQRFAAGVAGAADDGDRPATTLLFGGLDHMVDDQTGCSPVVAMLL
jgi:hypothetical protein